MATLYKQGTETSRWQHKATGSLYSLRSNSKVLRKGSFGGWKLTSYIPSKLEVAIKANIEAWIKVA